MESTEGKVQWSMSPEMRQQLEEMRDRWARHADALDKYDTYTAYTLRLGVGYLDRALHAKDAFNAAMAIERAMDLVNRVRGAIRDIRAQMAD